MPLDQKETDVSQTEIPETTTQIDNNREVTGPGPEIAPDLERPGLESGDNLETGRLTEGNEKVTRTELPQSAPVYQPVNDPAYQQYKKIESILEEDLGELYNNLTPAEQKVFKVKGEQAAREIFKLVYHQTKIKVKKIITLIRDWLKAIPGINRFFLEQEAKIKADKIIQEIKEESKEIKF